jgi:ComF family protein
MSTSALIVPVPLHPRRQRQRGYNQSALLARALVSPYAMSTSEHVLTRVKLTTPQVGLSAAARARNMDGAFAVEKSACGDKDILLVDDVCTTGATLSAAARSLRDGGARRIYGLVLAMAVLGHDT